MATPQQQGGRGSDPTENVKELVKAGFKTTRALRKADNRYYDQAMRDLKEISLMGREHIKDVGDLRSFYAKELRASDLAVANTSSAALATAVVALQNTTDRNAETLRSAVENSRSALAKQVTDTAAATQLQTNAANAAMDTRVSLIEKTINQGTGRQSVEDPQMALLIKNMQALITAQATGTGTAHGKDDSWKMVVGVVGILGMIAGLGFTIYASTHTTAPIQVAAPVAAAPGPPQIIYLQPPPAQPTNPPK